MDATYKTTKYELSMFFVIVKTRVGYAPIADFIVQSETGDKIADTEGHSKLESTVESTTLCD